MKKYDVQIDDLHALIKSKWEKNPAAPDHDNVHFDGGTNNALGKQVAAAIIEALKAPGKSPAADRSQSQSRCRPLWKRLSRNCRVTS